jgi:putative ABC transport system permease protein
MNPIPLLRAELKRAPRTAAALVILVALAVALAVAVVAFERGLRRGSADAASPFDLLIGAAGSPTQLVLTSVYLQPALLPQLDGTAWNGIARRPDVVAAAPLVIADSWRGYPVVGTTSAMVARLARVAGQGVPPFTAMDEAIVGADVPLDVGAAFQTAHGTEGPDHTTLPYHVVRRLPQLGTPYDRAILVPVESVWMLHGFGNGHKDANALGAPWDDTPPPVSALVVAPKLPADAFRVRADARKDGLVAAFPAEELTRLYALLGQARDAARDVALVAALLVALAALVAAAVHLAAASARLALLRALGAPRSYVLMTAWMLGAGLLAVGAVLGLPLGLGLVLLARAAASSAWGLRLPFEVGTAELAVALGAAIAGALLALLPAVSAYRRAP